MEDRLYQIFRILIQRALRQILSEELPPLVEKIRTREPRLLTYSETQVRLNVYYPKESNVTEAKVDGISYLNDLSVSQKKTEFVKEIDNLKPQDSSKPNQELREGVAFSSVALQVGIVYLLGSKGI